MPAGLDIQHGLGDDLGPAPTDSPERILVEFVSANPTGPLHVGGGRHAAYGDALRKAGAYVASDRLKNTTDATTVSLVNGKMQVIDGPFADTKEQLGGFYLIEAANLDEAISWAARCPAASHGKVEVRPIWAKG